MQRAWRCNGCLRDVILKRQTCVQFLPPGTWLPGLLSLQQQLNTACQHVQQQQPERQQQYPAAAQAILSGHMVLLNTFQHIQQVTARAYSARPQQHSSTTSRGSSSKGSKSRLPLPASIDWSQHDQQHGTELQQLPQQQRSGALSHQQQHLPGIPEGELMALIAAAVSITDIEAIVLQHHSQFKHYHIAAAVQKLPTLDMESSLNMRKRFNHLTSLLASGLTAVCRRLDTHQATACLAALTSPRCLPPFRHGPLLRLLLLLTEEDGARMRELHSYELAQCAAAAAAMQEAMLRERQEQQQQNQEEDIASRQRAPSQQLEQTDHHQNHQHLLTERQSNTADRDLPMTFTALSVSDSSSSGGSSGSSALALQDPLQRLWRHLHDVITPRLAKFSADSLALTALSFAAAGQTSQQLILGVVNAALARPQKFLESPVAVSRMLRALMLTDTLNEAVLSVLAQAVATQGTKSFTPTQLTTAAAAFAHLKFYHEPALLAVCKAATRALKHWKKSDVVSLLTSLEALRFRDEPFLSAAAKVLATAAEQASAAAAGGGGGGQQSVNSEQLCASLAALVQLGFNGQALEQLMVATSRHLSQTLADATPSASLSPSSAIKLLWVAAVLEEGDASIRDMLLGVLTGVGPQQLSQHDLRLLYQAHRLLNKDAWVSVRLGRKDQEPGKTEQQWPQQLLLTAQEAAAVYAAASAARSKQQMQAVQSAFEDVGFEPPITGFKVDGGALQPDLAFVADGSSKKKGSSSGSSSMKVALMCDHAGRFSRNAPHELLGFWRVSQWLLEAEGWRVVRLPAHEWRVLMEDRGARESSALAYVFNTLAAQGISL